MAGFDDVTCKPIKRCDIKKALKKYYFNKWFCDVVCIVKSEYSKGAILALSGLKICLKYFNLKILEIW